LSLGLAELVIIVIALVAVAKLAAAGRRNHDAAHRTHARAMGGRVVASEGDISRYAGAADGVEWTLRVVTADDVETPRKTTLIWRTASVRADRVLAIVGNDIREAGGWRSLAGFGYPLAPDPIVDPQATPARTGQSPPAVAFAQSARDVTGILHGLPEGFRGFAADHDVARRILTDEVTAAISRWHAIHGGALRIWAGGPDLRLMISEIHWPAPDAFRDLLDLGLLLARRMRTVTT
jgi:hypothetical protein